MAASWKSRATSLSKVQESLLEQAKEGRLIVGDSVGFSTGYEIGGTP